MSKYKLPLGFRFHPTDVELVKYYLKRKVLGKKFTFEAIAEIEIYKHAPWDLPDMSLLRTGDLKWFFFCPIEKKYGRGARLNRATVYGYWKTTGKDRPVTYNEEVVGVIKTLVFHRGKAPNGDRTDWVMHEYRLQEKELADRGVVQDTYVLCVVFKKDGWGPRNGAQYGAPFKEEDWSDDEDDNLVGPGSIAFLSKPSFDGASSSHVPESLCAEPSIQYSGICTLPAVANPDSSLVPESPCAEPSIQSSGMYALPPMANTDAAVNHTTGIDSDPIPLLVATDTNAALTCVGFPQVPVVAVNNAVPALMEAPQVQEPNDDILSMLEFFTEDAPFVTEDAPFFTENAPFFTHGNGQMNGNANNSTFQAPQHSEDDEIAMLLAPFKEDDYWNNFPYPFE